MEAVGNGIDKEKENVDSDAVNKLCVDVSSDEEEQEEFFNAFHKVCTCSIHSQSQSNRFYAFT